MASTNKELPELLEKRNVDGRYDELIAECKKNWYHDYKSPDDIDFVCPKVELLIRVGKFSELVDVYKMIAEGEFDEQADEEDKAMLRKDVPEDMWGTFGL